MTHDTSAVQEEYDRIASQYDRRWQPYIDATLKAVIEAVDCRGDEFLLDIPCGTGELPRRLSSLYPRLQIIGADLSGEMLRHAIGKTGRAPRTWIQADAAHLPLQDGTFDIVVCANSFHYFRYPAQSLREFRRVMKEGGTLIFVDWCDDYLSCKLCSLWLKWTDSAFHRMYSLGDCCSMLEDARFSIKSAQRFRINWLWGLMRVICH